MLTLFRQALVFGLAPLLQRAISLVLLPLFTNFLTPRDYGVIATLTLLSGIFGVLICLELTQPMLKALVEAKPDGERNRLFCGLAVLHLGTALAGSAAFVLLAPWLAGWFDVQLGGWLLWVVALGLFFDGPVAAIRALLRVEDNTRWYVGVAMAQSLLGTAGSVTAVMLLGLGPLGYFLGALAGSVLAIVAYSRAALPHFARPIPWRPGLRSLVIAARPLLLAALFYFAVRNADRIAVGTLLSPAELGIYHLAWTLAGLLLTLVYMPIQTSYEVWRYRQSTDEASLRLAAAAYEKVLMVVALAAAVMMTFGADAFVLLADEAYASAVRFLPPLCLAILFQTAYSMVSMSFYIAGATGLWSRLFSAAVTLALILVPALTWMLGAMGAPLATAIANLALYGAATHFSASLSAIRFAHHRLALLTVLLLLVGGARVAVAEQELWARLAWDAVLVPGFLAALFAARLLTVADCRGAWQAVGRRRMAGGLGEAA